MKGQAIHLRILHPQIAVEDRRPFFQPGTRHCSGSQVCSGVLGFAGSIRADAQVEQDFSLHRLPSGPEHHQSYWPLREENGLLVCAFKTEKRKKNILVDSSGNTWASIISLENIPGNSNCTKFSLV